MDFNEYARAVSIAIAGHNKCHAENPRPNSFLM